MQLSSKQTNCLLNWFVLKCLNSKAKQLKIKLKTGNVTKRLINIDLALVIKSFFFYKYVSRLHTFFFSNFNIPPTRLVHISRSMWCKHVHMRVTYLHKQNIESPWVVFNIELAFIIWCSCVCLFDVRSGIWALWPCCIYEWRLFQ